MRITWTTKRCHFTFDTEQADVEPENTGRAHLVAETDIGPDTEPMELHAEFPFGFTNRLT